MKRVQTSNCVKEFSDSIVAFKYNNNVTPKDINFYVINDFYFGKITDDIEGFFKGPKLIYSYGMEVFANNDKYIEKIDFYSNKTDFNMRKANNDEILGLKKAANNDELKFGVYTKKGIIDLLDKYLIDVDSSEKASELVGCHDEQDFNLGKADY